MDNPAYLPGQSAFEAPNYGAAGTYQPPPAGTYQPPIVPNEPQPDEIKAALAILSQATGTQPPPSASKPVKASNTWLRPDEWVPLAAPDSNCPHGLEYLLRVRFTK